MSNFHKRRGRKQIICFSNFYFIFIFQILFLFNFKKSQNVFVDMFQALINNLRWKSKIALKKALKSSWNQYVWRYFLSCNDLPSTQTLLYAIIFLKISSSWTITSAPLIWFNKIKRKQETIQEKKYRSIFVLTIHIMN